jgi:hypothetical protein
MVLGRYLRVSTASLDEVRRDVWAEGPDRDRETVLEQYKVYVEMADRVSARRGLTNTFFLTLNTLILTAVGMFWRERPAAADWYLSVPVVALLVQCAAWFWLLRSYRQLNSAKYIVIGALEEGLPASPYWRAEWTALGEGRDPSRYWPLTHLEQWTPISFAAIYLAAFVLVLAA